MHPYTVNSSERVKLTALIAILSVAIAYALQEFIISSPWIGPPSSITLFGLGFYLFDEYAWKHPWLHRSNVIHTPKLDGRWQGNVSSSYGGGTNIPIDIIIEQKWTRLVVSLETETSKSRSQAAFIDVSMPSRPRITYVYNNQPNPSSQESMAQHDGTANLELSSIDVLTGQYYTGRGRTTIGSISLKRIG